MQVFADQTFGQGEIVTLDGNAFKQCLFDHCTIVFRGEDLPTILRCTFVNCDWQFRGEAERTMAFVRSVHADYPEVVAEWFHVFDGG